MAQYTVSQLKQAAYNAGFRGNALLIAVAVSLAENGSRDPSAVSPKNRDGSRDHGAWQINDKAHPSLIRSGNVNNLDDNARMAYAVYKEAGKSFRPWTTYNSSSYKRNLTTAQNAKVKDGGIVGDIVGGALTGIAGTSDGLQDLANGAVTGIAGADAVSGISDVGSFLHLITDTAFWHRVGLGFLALIMLIIGILVMITSNKSVQNLAKDAGKVALVA